MTKVDQIIADLEEELTRSVEEALELDESIEGLRQAIAVLRGQIPATMPPPAAVHVAVQKASEPTGPRCGACGSEMFRDIRTLGNGKQVPLLVCRDSGCNNEQITQ